MSNDRNTGAAPTFRARRRPYSSGDSVRSSAHGITSIPISRGASHSWSSYVDPRIPAMIERSGSITPSSTARRNGVPWK